MRKRKGKQADKVAGMKVVRKRLDELVPAEYNPRRISEEALAGLGRSVEEFGYVEPIVWNRRTDRVVSGHQRLKVLARSGVDEADVVEVDLDEAQERALNVTMNNQMIQGDWDEGKLLEILDGLKEHEIAEGLFGDLRLNELLASLDVQKKKVVQDDVPEVPKKAITKKGDLWELGQHRLLCGD